MDKITQMLFLGTELRNGGTEKKCVGVYVLMGLSSSKIFNIDLQ